MNYRNLLRKAIWELSTIAQFTLIIPSVIAATQSEGKSFDLYSQNEVSAPVSNISLKNTFTALEAAGAHGTGRIELGIGAMQHISETDNDPSSDSQNLTPKFWVTSGIWWPFDMGFGYGQLSHDQTQVSTYLQWTVFEKFRWPAVALRAGGTRLFGISKTKVESRYLNVVGSWGYGPITLFTAYGASEENIQIISPVTLTKERWLQEQFNYGIQTQVIPGRAVFTIATTDRKFIEAKISTVVY